MTGKEERQGREARRRALPVVVEYHSFLLLGSIPTQFLSRHYVCRYLMSLSGIYSYFVIRHCHTTTGFRTVVQWEGSPFVMRGVIHWGKSYHTSTSILIHSGASYYFTWLVRVRRVGGARRAVVPSRWWSGGYFLPFHALHPIIRLRNL